MHRWVAAVAAGVVMVGALTACDKQSYECHNGSCDVSVSGNPNIDFGASPDSGRRGHTMNGLRVEGYTGDGVRLSAGGETRTVRTGRVAVVGGMRVRVVSVSGNSAKLHVDL